MKIYKFQVYNYIFEIKWLYVADNNNVLPVVFRICLSNIKFQILHWRSPNQILQSNQTKLIFIKNRSSGPIQKFHHVLKLLANILDYIPKRQKLSRHGTSLKCKKYFFPLILNYLISLVHQILRRMQIQRKFFESFLFKVVPVNSKNSYQIQLLGFNFIRQSSKIQLSKH